MSVPTFVCSRCGEAFAAGDELTAHIGRTHGDPVPERIDGWLAPLRDKPSRVPVRRRGAGQVADELLDGTKWDPITLMACVGLIVGAVFLSIAYSWAATHDTSRLHYNLFWLGEFVFLTPAAIRLLNKQAGRAERLGMLVMVGLFSYLPKFLRDPSGPLFHDELAHWHQAQSIFNSGQIFAPNRTISIIEYYPGLNLLTAELRHLTGLSTFQTGTILLACLHVISLIGIFLMTERLTKSSRVAGIAALIYSLNPSFMFFQSQYAYESLSIVFFIWVIACVVGMQTESDASDAKSWFAIGLVLAAGCIVTHHLATYILIVALLMIALVAAALRAKRGRSFILGHSAREQSPFRPMVFMLLVLAGAAAWLVFVAPRTIAYLDPYLVGGVRQVLDIFGHERSARQLFAKSVVPIYQRYATYLVPICLALCAGLGLVLVWRNRRQVKAIFVALALFGLLYFASLPLMLTQIGVEGARRTWAYSQIGLCVLIAPVAAVAITRSTGKLKRRSTTGLVIAVLGIVLIGNVTVQVNEAYMFPGPYLYGSDTRSLDAELLGMVRWFRANQGTNQRVVADRSTSLPLAAIGDEWTANGSEGFPIWQLFFWTSDPGAWLVRELVSSHYEYLVIDRRMARELPAVGVYFTPEEPLAYIRTSPPPAAALEKYEFLPWVSKIYTSDNLEIYRFNFGTLDSPVSGSHAPVESEP